MAGLAAILGAKLLSSLQSRNVSWARRGLYAVVLLLIILIGAGGIWTQIEVGAVWLLRRARRTAKVHGHADRQQGTPSSEVTAR